ncbi:levanase [Sphingomonas oleivorans]|uniref:Levanase n=1 Tax=Sphingomonas oleivorans TaxID=1735121 RepID=A0A2T5FZP6_9SPHN|nr:glycoside hydrolase family 32 protein [Sphingomonas oleivorans]PTQ12184.1 levanase [Sphingomonas oleivorans]
MTSKRFRRTAPRRSLRIAVATVAALLGLAALATVAELQPSPAPGEPVQQTSTSDSTSDPQPVFLAAEENDSAASQVSTAGLGELRPEVHLTSAYGWMNDPQRPFFLNGRWHLYYLYNEDYPTGNGTEWFHVTSTDLVHWVDEGVAIHKYTRGDGDIQSGSAVIDVNNTAGFGAGAIIVVATQQLNGVQTQSLFYSTDGGYTFEQYAGNPVQYPPVAGEDFRDPKISWDAEHSRWLMLISEPHKVAFYTSTNLKQWSYLSGFVRNDLGIMECPELFRMAVDGDPSRTTWVLATGANGFNYGMNSGYAYWTGSWDGTNFHPDRAEPQWLDNGSDFYAAISWTDPRQTAEEQLRTRYAIGWTNNWDYARLLPAGEWGGNHLSLVREVHLRDIDGRLTLTSRPVDAIGALEGEQTRIDQYLIGQGETWSVPQPTSPAYRLRASIAQDPSNPAREVRLKLKTDGTHFATVGYDFATETAFIVRDHDAIASQLTEVYRHGRTIRVRPHDGIIDLDIVVDRTSIEMFVNGDEHALSAIVYGANDANGITAEAFDGRAVIRSMSVTRLAPAPPVRGS